MRLPTPYKDELIGSLLMRARLHSGLPPSRLLMRLDIAEERQSTVFLPNGLAELARHSRLDAEELLWGHTVFPFSVAYMTSHNARKYQATLLREGAAGATAGALVAHTAPQLRFCPDCAIEDYRQLGESYWRRSHCLPASIVCREHNKILSKPAYTSKSLAKLMLAPLPHRQLADERFEEAFFPRWIVEAGANATTVGAGWDFKDDWHAVYRRSALERGFDGAGHIVASAKLAHELRVAAGPSCLAELGLDFEQPAGSWPTLMVRAKVQPRFAPLKHLVLGAFLDQHQPGETTFTYKPAGGKAADYAALDKRLSEFVRRRTIELICKGRTATLELLMAESGAWQTFRCRKALLPLTCATVEAFKKSAASKRRTGGSEVYQRRLEEIAAGRQKPMKSYRERLEARDRTESTPLQ
ncbi:TnsD family Tn7-like transposition protein [Roseateles sp.]|uniref:TnsD family Tn7-like transposition protein n=1 Tax=Roseateles sp. TaxID=1971397 RepID=UPI0039E9D9BD